MPNLKTCPQPPLNLRPAETSKYMSFNEYITIPSFVSSAILPLPVVVSLLTLQSTHELLELNLAILNTEGSQLQWSSRILQPTSKEKLNQKLTEEFENQLSAMKEAQEKQLSQKKVIVQAQPEIIVRSFSVFSQSTLLK